MKNTAALPLRTAHSSAYIGRMQGDSTHGVEELVQDLDRRVELKLLQSKSANVVAGQATARNIHSA